MLNELKKTHKSEQSQTNYNKRDNVFFMLFTTRPQYTVSLNQSGELCAIVE